jgi:hypothetical protein
MQKRTVLAAEVIAHHARTLHDAGCADLVKQCAASPLHGLAG